MEMIKAVELVSGRALNYRLGPRRAGDVVSVFANFDRAKSMLNWSPTNDITQIFRSVLNTET